MFSHIEYILCYHSDLANSKLCLFLEFVVLLIISPVNVADKRSNTPLGQRPGESDFTEFIEI